MIDRYKNFSIFLFLFLMTYSVLAAKTGTIEGYVKDRDTKDVLPGANVFLVGTSIGGATDLSGHYKIKNIPPGSYTLRIKFIGYELQEIPVQIEADVLLTKDVSLAPVALEGQAVVVTIQAEGQKAAINQQLSAKSIKNIVSSKQIQELPDANAAESIRRLPGVSITREGGEGNQVVIRGLAPKYNAITIDGVRMASSNKDDRGADLSMISSTMLEGIEVSKTITADQDADMLGGTVNFKLREARGGQAGLQFNLLSQGGYTGLSGVQHAYQNYKFVPSVEGRFLEDRLGVFFQANLERRNLTSNDFSSDYSPKGNSNTDYITNSLNFNNIPRDKKRTNGALVMDYKLPEGKISFTNFVSSGTTIQQNRGETVNVGSNQHNYSLNYSKSTLNMLHNSLNLDQQLPLVHADLKLSHSYSETDNPEDWAVSFYQIPANLASFLGQANLNPKVLNDAVLRDANLTHLNTIYTYDNFAKERSLTAALDLDFPINFSTDITSKIKFGGKIKRQKRSYTSEVYGTNATLTSPSARAGAQLISDYIGWTGDPSAIPLSMFIDNDYEYGDILDGDFTMHNPMDFDAIEDIVHFTQDNVDAFTADSPEAFARNNYLSNTNNYSGEETLAAGYIMATINIGQQLVIIPGVRYQNLETSYSGAQGQQTTFSFNFYNHIDTTVTLNHPFWLPNLNIQYKPLSWFDVRLAWSNTVSYPDFNAILPRIDATASPALAWNNYKLDPIESKNYDVYFSVSENKVGLFTVGGFLKKIKNVIYPWTFSVPGREAEPYYLPGKRPNTRWVYTISTYINNPYVIDNWGLEFDWQTHFWYLPDPLKGLVLNVNYTHVYSEAEYPYQAPGTSSFTTIDTSYTDRLIYQPDHILNFTVGYDYKDFSVRVSMLYQNDVFSYASQWPQERSNTASYKRWDVSMKQQLPWSGLELYGNLNNLNSSRDLSVLQLYPNIPVSSAEYGMTAELGLRWQLQTF
ncbi:TonB-dependent receptor [candidate division KSB1 bacterium]|nr:TonB-dependent receptor [candidate division KSB1 bacterium]